VCEDIRKRGLVVDDVDEGGGVVDAVEAELRAEFGEPAGAAGTGDSVPVRGVAAVVAGRGHGGGWFWWV
jgi:hypothetical protein